MKFKITKLGVVDTMEIDLSNPFILFAGENGMGKTYAASFIYTLTRYFAASLFPINKDNEYPFENQTSSPNGISGTINPDALHDYVSDTVSCDATKKTILAILNLNVLPEKFNCKVVTTKEAFREQIRSADINILGIRKEKGSFEYSIQYPDLDIKGNESFLDRKGIESFEYSLFIAALVLDGVIGAHMFTAERNGIYTFSKEIAVGRLRMPEVGTASRYPAPIADGLANAEDIKHAKKQQSDGFGDLANEIEDRILHGKLSIDKDGDIKFSTTTHKRLDINESSSTVKTLAPLIFYLRHWSDRQNLLIIDEPELNLHPKNQVLLTRIFVKMVNAGIRLVISTHSDYIIREINNAIMANELTKYNDRVVEEFEYDTTLCLAKEKFQPYLFRTAKGRVNVEPLPVDKFGFSMPSIDETIDKQNEITNALYETLKYNHSENHDA